MQISYSKFFMTMLELRNVADTTRKYSEEDKQYVVDTKDLKGPLEALVKLIKGEEK